MAWTEITRLHYDRRGQRYSSDCTDDEWVLIDPFLRPRSNVGRPREVDMRDVWDAIQYIAQSGCQWSMLPKDFPPFRTVQYHFYRFRDAGLFDLINDALTMAARVLAEREPAPTAGIIDSQSVKTTEGGGPRGYGEPGGRHWSEAHGERQENKRAETPYRDGYRGKPFGIDHPSRRPSRSRWRKGRD